MLLGLGRKGKERKRGEAIYPEAQCMTDVGDAFAEVIDTVWRSRTIRGAHMEVSRCYEDLKIFETDFLLQARE